MIYKSALLAAAAVAIVALLTSKNVAQHRTVNLNGLAYEIIRYSNDTVEVIRQDGLRFTVNMKSGAVALNVGTQGQFEDALTRLKAAGLPELNASGAPA